MTEHEKKQHRANLLIEIEDAESTRAFQQDNALQVADFLERIAGKIRRNAGRDPSPADFTPEGDIQNRLTPDQIAKFPDACSVAQIIEDLKKDRQVVFNLRERKQKLSSVAAFSSRDSAV